MAELKKVFFENTSELRSWLERNFDKSESVWLVKWKKGLGKSYISYDEMVDELMCFGWIDSLPKNLDDQKTMHRISPRNPKSNWSGLNKERIRRLTKTGKMTPSGLKVIEQAKINGTWNFLDDVEQLMIPSDLEEALNNDSNARYYFDRFPDSSKRNILEWTKNAKQDSTREKRISETVAKAAQNIKANHPKGRDSGPKPG